ncbi:unnamed protein product [Spirodela intermedia]|uniref:Uncharacterized protein n=1 Tax=Spirodela intermedia TaxID=51605 RepID=A0A7I8K9K6_SPIIN|nr:unnamed protein product [Spirodela intermedia]
MNDFNIVLEINFIIRALTKIIVKDKYSVPNVKDLFN